LSLAYSKSAKSAADHKYAIGNTKNAEYGIQVDFACKKLINSRVGLDIKVVMKQAESGPTFAHHEVNPLAIDGLTIQQ
jgi:hypothetical protein